MITENKTIKVRTEHTQEALKELNAPSIKLANRLIIGSCLAATLFVLLIFVFYYYENPNMAGVMFGFFIGATLVLLVGVILKYSIKKNLNTAVPPTVFDYEFFDGGVAAKETVNGEVLHVSKYYNSSVCKTLEGKRYLFIYVTAATALVVDKTQLSPAELDTIKFIYFHQYTGECLSLSEFKPGIPAFTPYPDETPNEQT